jgi:hypothetical protein
MGNVTTRKPRTPMTENFSIHDAIRNADDSTLLLLHEVMEQTGTRRKPIGQLISEECLRRGFSWCSY